MIDVLAQGRSRARMPRSLILEPTRELAAQVAENFEKYGKYHKLSMALLIGGVSMGDQQKALEKGVDVLIATPGRLMDLFGRGKILLTGCGLLVIDEADRMLDMGFIPDIEEICTKLPTTRQTLLFSATMPGPIKKLSERFLQNPKTVEASRPATANASIDQRLVRCDARKKKDVLISLLRREEVESAIIFSNRKTTVRELTTSLQRGGFKAGPIHGDMEQPERLRELDRFKSGEINILVASDVAARGLDIKGVSHVFNFDVPWQADDYIHRIGRTGRAGATGVAITLAAKDDAEKLETIEKMIGRPIPALDAAEIIEAEPAATEETAEQPGKKPRRPRRKAAEAQPVAEPEAVEVEAAVVSHQEEPARKGREPRTPREARAPRATREPREPRAAEPRHQPRLEDSGGDQEGWNGPIPSFLGQGFGG
jgi:superfamily II DNA/RNA helicase